MTNAEKVTEAMRRILMRIFQRGESEFAVYAHPDRIIQIKGKRVGNYKESLEFKNMWLIGVYSKNSSARDILDDLETYFKPGI